MPLPDQRSLRTRLRDDLSHVHERLDSRLSLADLTTGHGLRRFLFAQSFGFRQVMARLDDQDPPATAPLLSRIAEALEAGRNVAVLCEGDPFFYGSFMYLHARLADRFPVEVIPGITSVSAGAARAAAPLTARNEVLTVLPGPLDSDTLAARIADADSIVIMKVGRHLARIRDVLFAQGLSDRAVYIERATLAAERILPLAQAPDPAPYFSLILVTKGSDPWL